MRFPWHYDPARQQFETPMGVIRLYELAASRYEALCGNYTITTGPWAGFCVRGKKLRFRFRGRWIDLTQAQLMELIEKAGLAGQ